VDSLTEFCFLIDIALNFFIEYKSDEKLLPIRDPALIAERYLKGTFLLDFLAFTPFVPVITSSSNAANESISDNQPFGYLQLLFLLKVIRVKKIMNLI
jgi:hypothetical protein